VERKSGSIVNIASIGGIVGVKGRFAYCATKFAVVGMTKCVAIDFADSKVRCNAICPGRVETPWVSQRISEYPDPRKAYDEMAATQALKRMGTPEEVAAAAVYLASDEAAFVTGSALILDGGWTAGKDIEIDERALARLNADSYVSREYLKNGNQIGLFIAYYAHQKSGGYMHSPKVCLPSSGWEIEEPGSIQVNSPDGTVPINRYVISKSGEKSLILYWYQSSDRILADEYWTKLYLIHDGLVHGRAAGSVVRIQLPLDRTVEKDAIPFAAEVMADLRRVFSK